MVKLEEAPSTGRHNENFEAARDRLVRGSTYKDCSTVCIIPTRGLIPVKVAQSWLGLMNPMNQKFHRVFMEKHEVGEAYNLAIEAILANPELSKWKYILTLEEDNIVPPDGLLKLLEAMEQKTDLGHKPDVIGGLYWTKGENGQPMIYGSPQERPRNYIPQVPKIDTLQECNGLGQGFTLFRLNIFKNERMTKPYFKTVQEYIPGQGVKLGTQDLYFFENAAKLGYRFACDTRVKVGHYDLNSDTTW
jgi:hypothetical protein